MTHPILVTGAAGRVGGVGGLVVEALRRRGLPVRATVRREDERAEALRATGAEVVVGGLTCPADVGRTLAGCRRLYFGMSVSARPAALSHWGAAIATRTFAPRGSALGSALTVGMFLTTLSFLV